MAQIPCSPRAALPWLFCHRSCRKGLGNGTSRESSPSTSRSDGTPTTSGTAETANEPGSVKGTAEGPARSRFCPKQDIAAPSCPSCARAGLAGQCPVLQYHLVTVTVEHLSWHLAVLQPMHQTLQLPPEPLPSQPDMSLGKELTGQKIQPSKNPITHEPRHRAAPACLEERGFQGTFR